MQNMHTAGSRLGTFLHTCTSRRSCSTSAFVSVCLISVHFVLQDRQQPFDTANADARIVPFAVTLASPSPALELRWPNPGPVHTA